MGRGRYRIELTKRAARTIIRLDARTSSRIEAAIDSLAMEPRPRSARKLTGARDLYRIRCGDYRVVYQIRDRVLIVLVIAIDNRREIYSLVKRLFD